MAIVSLAVSFSVAYTDEETGYLLSFTRDKPCGSCKNKCYVERGLRIVTREKKVTMTQAEKKEKRETAKKIKEKGATEAKKWGSRCSVWGGVKRLSNFPLLMVAKGALRPMVGKFESTA